MVSPGLAIVSLGFCAPLTFYPFRGGVEVTAPTWVRLTQSRKPTERALHPAWGLAVR
jgi:hypothetical protein